MTAIGSDDYLAGTDTTGSVAVGGSATGKIEVSGDRDWFALELEAGKTYRIDLEGLRTRSGTLWDPEIGGVRNSDGEDQPYTGYDDYSATTNSTGFFAPSKSGTYYVEASANWAWTGTYTVWVSEVGADDYAADTDTTGSVSVGGPAVGEIEVPDDVDWFAVELEADTRYRVDLEGSWTKRGTLIDTILRGILNSDGEYQPGTYDNNGGERYNSRTHFTADDSGTHYIAVSGSYWGATGTYTLSVVEDAL